MKKAFKYPLVIFGVFVFIVLVTFITLWMSSNYDGPRSYIQVAVLFVLFTLGWIPLVIAFLIGLIIDKKSQKPKM